MPITFILYYCIFAGAVVVSFLDISFALHLKPLHLSPILVGAVFLISGGVYALLSPLLGYILDKTGWYKRSMALGGLLALVAFSLMGPSPFLFLPKDSLWLNIVASVVLGISFCTLLIPPLQELVTAAIKSGYPENLDTYGITSGLYKSAFYIGTFAGSVGGGFILDKIGFSWTALIIGLIGVSCTLLLALYGAVKMFCFKATKDGCLI
ncbi:unnamed protein product [Owenia fusiformis]|uniref:Major facilitator superfamily (MFS) profile domain-containing protein n=1 Tax=Owenia fusiformis TaxID=6347 RepID=A0A8S4PVY3_OWEFU|nr:unnamed protein product [Owenia fusiformis]